MDRIKSPLKAKWSVLVLTLVLVVTPVASANAWTLWDVGKGITDTLLVVISGILYILLISVMGWFATLATKLLVYTAQLNNFTDLPVIVEAWQVVRDLSNMFFILILLVIAFGTLFRLEAYSWKKLLPKMILAAILVNYSRAICGFLVDASQVVMLTFVAAIKDAAVVGLTSAFQLDKLLAFGTTSNLTPDQTAATTTATQRLLAIIAAGFMLATMFTVQCVYIVVLIGRLVMIWFLTVLSPLAYITRVLPQTERYSSQWWEMFARYLVVGPMCMFFLWLAMFIAAKSIDSGGLGSVAASEQVAAAQLEDSDDAGALDTTLISGFIIASMMLMAGMKLAQENSSELGEYTGKVASLSKIGTMFGATFLASKALGYANDLQFSKTGVDLNGSRIIDRWKHGLDANKKAKVTQGESIAAQKYREGYLLAGATGAGDQVAELGIKSEQLRGGLMGNIPLLRNWKWARQLPTLLGGGRQGKFERAHEEENQLQDESSKNEEQLAKMREASYFTTTDEFDKEHAAKLAGTKNLLDASNPAERAIMQKYQAALADMATDPTLSEDERKKSDAGAKAMQQQIKNNGKVDVSQATWTGINKDFKNLITTTQTEAKKDADEFTKDDARKRRTKYGALTEQSDIENALNEDAVYKKLTTRQDAILGQKNTKGVRRGGALALAKAKREAAGSLMGSGGELKLRKLINESAQGITSEDTTELCDGFKDALHKKSGFGPEALAYFDRIAATNNVNDLLSDPSILEMLHKIDPKLKGQNAYSQQGMKALSQLMINEFGLPEQAVMSTMHRGFQHMKRAGNTFMSEQTEVKNGNYTWRSKEDWQKVALIESRKRNTSQQLSNATRLQLGDGDKFYDEQRFTLENLGTLVAPSLGTDNRLRLNSDIIRHLATDPRRYMVMRNKLINSIPDKAQRTIALKALNEAMRKGQIDLSDTCDEDKILDEDTKAYPPTNVV